MKSRSGFSDSEELNSESTHTGEESPIQALKLVHPGQSPVAISVGVDLRLKGALLTARFSVQSSGPIYANHELPRNQSQWGLWDWDVVELFVSATGEPSRTPYYEFQVSPLNQFLELEIFEPRKRFNREYQSGFEHSARSLDGGNWEAQMTLPLEQMGWDGKIESITGNAFAILGPPGSRTYWSLFLGPQQKPDFHLPNEFKGLV